MTTSTVTPYRSELTAGRDSFGRLLRAEWTKFRTVRGWIVGVFIAALVTVGIAMLDHSSCGNDDNGVASACSSPIGPDGEAVTDSYAITQQPMTGNGTITARVTSLAGGLVGSGGAGTGAPVDWAKAGILIAPNFDQGSAYAAMMVTGDHGVRMQYNYIHDTPGLAGSVSAASPRWLRLTRSGDTITGYESTDGTTWTEVGTADLPGLPATVRAGMFATSPSTGIAGSSSLGGSSGGGAAMQATGTFDHISVQSQSPVSTWSPALVGGGPSGKTTTYPQPGQSNAFQQSGGTFTVTGSGDISPAGNGTPVERTLFGVLGAVIAVIVVAAMFATAEYRRGLIRVTLVANPRRGRVLAAKALVAGAVGFAAGLVGACVALPLGEQLLRSDGNFILPVGGITVARILLGTGLLVAVTAVLATALGALVRSSAAAITIGIVAIVLPYLLATLNLPTNAADWLMRATPAAAFSIQQTVVQYPQVDGSYTIGNGYFPLAPWAGFAVLCGYTAVLLALAAARLQKQDA
jgi:ABC-type transport system involved in multi-copper enzyme maturation permease subunit